MSAAVIFSSVGPQLFQSTTSVAVVSSTQQVVEALPDTEVTVVDSADEARELVASEEVDAAVLPGDGPAGLLVLGDREAALARELTKLFETVLDGPLDDLLAQVQADPNQRRGEFVLIVEGAADDAEAKLIEGRRLYALLGEHLPPSTAARLAAELSGAPRKALYGGG